MRFGISATSWIFPKNLRTRLRPVNVCAISSLLAVSDRRAGTTLQKAAIHRDRQDRRRSPLFSMRFGSVRTAPFFSALGRDIGDSGGFHPEITALCSVMAGFSRLSTSSPVAIAARGDPRLSRRSPGDFAQVTFGYLSSTLAPTFSSVALTFSASSLFTPSLTGL